VDEVELAEKSGTKNAPLLKNYLWIRPLPSRWDNVTHSNLSAKPEKVTELRGKTAAALFAKIKNPSEVSVKNFEALAEVAVYSPQEKYVKLLKNVKSQLEKRKKSGGEEKHFNSIVKYLKKHKVL
jgi:benzoyl-CoA reductase/2-hydroxyglutaryl-CoA dehydratase subunit BcrC/BadD/HgdB